MLQCSIISHMLVRIWVSYIIIGSVKLGIKGHLRPLVFLVRTMHDLVLTRKTSGHKCPFRASV
jgi:hypothetical protein